MSAPSIWAEYPGKELRMRPTYVTTESAAAPSARRFVVSGNESAAARSAPARVERSKLTVPPPPSNFVALSCVFHLFDCGFESIIRLCADDLPCLLGLAVVEDE